jgi:DNA polymerase II large subunit
MNKKTTDTCIISSEILDYFNNLQKEIDKCYYTADVARKKGLDPECSVEIPQALDLAARVEKLVGPQGIAPKIRSITNKIGDRELVSLEIAKQIVSDKKYKFKRLEDGLDQAIRTGLAILTEGVLVAPLEGIAEVKLGKNNDRTNYVDLYFSGPIRSAGGTGQAMSVLIADVVRRELNVDRYKPSQGEIERYKEEIPLYKRAQHLQYTPSLKEIDKIIRGCPICINGEGTEDEEVTGYRDLPRLGTNRLRGGACLVIAEGLCLKAPKILKHVKKLKLKEWDFLDIFVDKDKNHHKEKGKDIPEILPSTKYLGEVIAGRPVFSHPSRKGGFRLRYGRARTGGLASTALNPISMKLLDEFIAIGTQIKTERPGKGTIGTPCSNIEGPIVLLKNGDLIQINDNHQIQLKNIRKIIDLGEILIPYGEFLENNTYLPEASYTFEWWIQDLQKKLGLLPSNYDIKTVSKADNDTKIRINDIIGRVIDLNSPKWKDAIEISEKMDIPLHPSFNLFWHDVSIQEIIDLSIYVKKNGFFNNRLSLILPFNEDIKDILIEIGALHIHKENNLILDRYAQVMVRCLGLDIKDGKIIESNKYKNLIENGSFGSPNDFISILAGITIKKRAPCRIGTRMGRPEKAAARKMRPPPHVLFPVKNFGGNQRLIRNAADLGTIEIEAGVRFCPNCGEKTYKLFCRCGTHTEIKNDRIESLTINLSEDLKLAQKKINERNLPETIKGVIGTISKNKTPEPLEKGILRAKYNIHVFKDGTTRFDMTDAPLTHFRIRELGISIERFKELGYTRDYIGDKICNYDQICELKVQDIIISKSCAEYFAQVAKFIDDLLVKYYGAKRFYKIRKLEHLIGHLTVGLAPHTSAGILSRIIGFTGAQVCYAHPFYHASKRRNCDGDEDALMLLMDALLNFSHAYIPDKRGGKMDLPLILTTRIDPSEVDKEAHNVDTLSRYPLEFFEATTRHEHSKEFESKMGLVSSRLGCRLQYEQFGFTHDTEDISLGPKISNYKSLKTMMDKMNAQLNLAAKIRAVDEADVAYKVIERHFLPDILGNLRAFSRQSVRCPICNVTYRRPPLQGFCIHCNGKLTLTVHEKSVKKYLEISKEIADKYNISSYAQQRLKLVEKSINSLFMSDKVRSTRLDDFF